MAIDAQSAPEKKGRRRSTGECPRFPVAPIPPILSTGIVCHEIGNVLTAISCSTQLLLAHPEDCQLHIECTRHIQRAIEHARRIFSDYQNSVCAVQPGAMTVDIAAVLKETFSLLSHQMAMRQVTLETDIAPNLPPITGSPLSLQQLFINLISNAVKAMPRGGLLTVSSRAEEDGFVTVKFRDMGYGILKKDMQNIFDPYFTAEPSGEGTGLGLFISQHIMLQHRGTILVESTVGEGSTVSLRFPAAIPDQPNDDVQDTRRGEIPLP